jgi:hypothetical protein
MAPVWIPPVTVKLEARAALPEALFERAERVGPGAAHHQGEKADPAS